MRSIPSTGRFVLTRAGWLSGLRPNLRPKYRVPLRCPRQRERAVLRWLPTRLTAREIANELFISMNTLKSHLKTIYRKLDATSRADAVARAVAHGLLPATEVGHRRVIDLSHDVPASTE